jgi:hypothetical protein
MKEYDRAWILVILVVILWSIVGTIWYFDETKTIEKEVRSIVGY